MLAYIANKNPGFFDQFAAAIQSGDHLQVAAAITQANVLQREAMLEVTKTDQGQFATQLRSTMQRSALNPLIQKGNAAQATMPTSAARVGPDVDNNVALFVVFVVFIVVAIMAFLAKPVPPGSFQGITFERYVNEIVTAFPCTTCP